MLCQDLTVREHVAGRCFVDALQVDEIEEDRADFHRNEGALSAVGQLDDAVERRRRERLDELVQVQCIASAKVGDGVGAEIVAVLRDVLDVPVERVLARAAGVGISAAHAAERVVTRAAVECVAIGALVERDVQGGRC